MFRSIYFLFIFLQAFVVYAQKNNPKADSLEQVLKTAKDTNRINTYLELARVYAKSMPAKAIKYAEMSQKESVLIGYAKGEADALTAITAMIMFSGEAKKALQYQNTALQIYEKTGNKKGIGNSLNNLGMIYSKQSNYPLALEHYQKALSIREDIKDEKGILSCLNNIGAIYTKQANENPNGKFFYEKSREYYARGLPIAQKTKNDALEASLLNNIGGTFDNQKDYDKALDYYLKALEIYEKTNNKNYLVSSYHVVGDVYLNKHISDKLSKEDKRLDVAENYQKRSLKIAEETKNKSGIAQAKHSLSRILMARGNYTEALTEALGVVTMCQSIDDPNMLIKSKLLLSEIYETTGNPTAALKAYQEATLLKESIFNETNSKQMAGLQESFAVAQRDAQLKLQAEEQKAKDARNTLFNYSLIGVLILVAGGAFLLYRGQQRQKLYNKEIATEKAKSDELLLNILPEEVAEELKEKGSATAQHYDKVSVLFTDFQGFTKRTANMTPTEVIAELNQCFSKFDAIIEKYNLEKIKTIGDAYMCAGGLPVPNTTNPIDAVRAGLEIQQYMEAYKAECEAKGEAYFRCRLGINTGEVVAGVVGTKKFAYDIWGDTVNTASRTESGGEVGMVNITEATYQEIKDYFECEYRGQIEVKGKGAINMYFVLKEKTNV